MSSSPLGTVRLTVSDLDRARAFYEGALGLCAQEGADGDLRLGVPDAPALVRLHGDPSAPRLDRRATGLYHVAILLPSRLDLAQALARLADAGWPLDGASDHLVSEALYLSDPDGNGIELYRDRPREEWPHRNGELQMATLALDLRDLAGELQGASGQPAAPDGTVIGHVHLQVADIPAAEAFYHGVLGFDVTTRAYPGALFVSTGGYHHHIGLNTWHSAGSGPALPDAVGLRSYEVVLEDDTELEGVLRRAEATGLNLEPPGDDDTAGIVGLRDPSGNLVRLRLR